MQDETRYTNLPLTIEDVTAMQGVVAVEFGENSCPYCIAAQPLFREALKARSGIAHFQIEDGKGRRLGRHFRVKLWPTLIVLRDGQEIGRVVRPPSLQAVLDALPAT